MVFLEGVSVLVYLTIVLYVVWAYGYNPPWYAGYMEHGKRLRRQLLISCIGGLLAGVFAYAASSDTGAPRVPIALIVMGAIAGVGAYLSIFHNNPEYRSGVKLF